MGLDIVAKVSKKDYHAGYSALHDVRWLALICCGWPRTIGKGTDPGIESRLCASHIYVVPPGITGQEMTDMVMAAEIAGHMFPNLLLHSDCEGKYTKKGKVDLSTWTSGNSVALLKELEIIKKNTPAELRVAGGGTSRPWQVFTMLYDLVEDEVENGAGHLEFH